MSSLMKGNQLIWLLLFTYLDFATNDNITGTSFLLTSAITSHFVNDMQTSMLFLLHLLQHITRECTKYFFNLYFIFKIQAIAFNHDDMPVS